MTVTHTPTATAGPRPLRLLLALIAALLYLLEGGPRRRRDNPEAMGMIMA